MNLGIVAEGEPAPSVAPLQHFGSGAASGGTGHRSFFVLHYKASYTPSAVHK